MSTEREQILSAMAEHRAALRSLERDLNALEASREPGWPPTGFYLTFYVVSGLLLGVLGSITSFMFHIVGSVLTGRDPLQFLRVYGTVFLGDSALTTTDLSFFMLVAVVHFSVGAAAGAVFHVVVNRLGLTTPLRVILLGAAYGLIMWIVNFYVVLSWLQPGLVGEAYVLRLMPAWIAAATHLIYGLTLGVLQPLGRFVPYEPRGA